MTAIHDKIKKLLALGNDKAATEDEAETAMRMAASLAAKHGIELNSLRTDASPKVKINTKRSREEMPFHQVFAALAAAKLFGVQMYTYDEGKRGFEMTGREENVELATETMMWLFRQIDQIYKQSLRKGMSQRERAEFRRTFKAACALRVHERAEEIMEQLRKGKAAVEGHNALVVQGYYETLEQEIRDYYKERNALSPAALKRIEEARLAREQWERDNPEAAERERKEREAAQKKWEKQQAKRKPPRGRSMPTGSGTGAGYAAGDRVQLRKGIE